MPLDHRIITGLFTARTPDSGDEDLHPDRVTLWGRATFTPQYSVPLVQGGEHIVVRPIDAVIEDGQLLAEVLDGDEVITQPLSLPVTVDDAANQAWSWRLEFQQMRVGQFGDSDITLPSRRFPVEAGEGPLDLADLSGTWSGGRLITRGERGLSVVDVEEADGEVRFVLEDGGRTAAVQLPPGPPGPANRLRIGTVTEGDASATLTGEAPEQTLSLTLPKGDTGPRGPEGPYGGTEVADPQVASWVGDASTETGGKLELAFRRDVSVKEFGAVGDSVADDTAAFQGMLNYLAANGGTGTIPPGTYRVTTRLLVQDPLNGFTVAGAGRDQVVVTIDANVPFNGWQIDRGHGVTLSGFTLDASNSPYAQGIAISDTPDAAIEDVDVRNYGSTAIIAYGATQKAIRNRIVRCRAFGGGIGRNGFLLEDAEDSVMEDCTVYDLDLANTPGFALQLKNDSRNCVIRGGAAYSSVAAVAIASDHVGTMHRNHLVTGVLSVGCTSGFVASSSENIDVDMQIDSTNRVTGSYSVRLLAGCSKVNVRASIDNLHVSDQAVYMGASDNTVTITRMNKSPSNVARFADNVAGSVVHAPQGGMMKYTRGGGAQPVFAGAALDTYPRYIWSLVTGWDGVGSSTSQLRRVGPWVSLSLQLRGPSSETVDTLALPSGFRPGGTIVRDLLAAGSSTPVAKMTLTPSGVLTGTFAQSSGSWGYVDFLFPTNDPFPTVIPGVN